MGQEEIYEYLKEHTKRWYTSTHISKALKISSGSACTGLRKLRNSGFLKYKIIERNVYAHKIKESDENS